MNKNYFGNLYTSEDASDDITSSPIDAKQQNKVGIQVVFEPIPVGILVVIEFSAIPDDGNWVIGYNDLFSDPIFAGETGSFISSALQSVGLDGVAATGDYDVGLTLAIPIQLSEYNEDGPFIITTNTLTESATPVDITIGDPTEDVLHTIEGELQLQVSNDNGRDSQTNTISITNWIDYSTPVTVDTSVSTTEFITIGPALGNWYRLIYTADSGEGTATANFSCKG